MGDKHGKGTKTQVPGTCQGCIGNDASSRDLKPGCNGSIDGVEWSIGIDYENRVRRDSPFRIRLVGGIIAQLIEETEDQLGDAQVCIARVQKEMEKLQRRLANLKRLQALQQQQQQPE
jgi:hypothetical protein